MPSRFPSLLSHKRRSSQITGISKPTTHSPQLDPTWNGVEGPATEILDFVRVDYRPDSRGHWTYKRSGGPEKVNIGEYARYSFCVLRQWKNGEDDYDTFIDIKNFHLKEALKRAMGRVPGISWNASPLQLTPQTILTFWSQILTHLQIFTINDPLDRKTTHLKILVDFFQEEYNDMLETVATLISHQEVTFEHAWCYWVPGSIMYTKCRISGEPRAVKLTLAVKETFGRDVHWNLQCEYTEASGLNGTSSTAQFGTTAYNIIIPEWRGNVPISSLRCYPMIYHPDEEGISKALVERGRKWVGLSGIKHVAYDGIAFSNDLFEPKVTVTSRVMIDKGTYTRINPSHRLPVVENFRSINLPTSEGYVVNEEGNSVDNAEESLTEEQLMLATPLLYGFSLSDKLWRTRTSCLRRPFHLTFLSYLVSFNVENVSPIQWQSDAFEHLVLPEDQKSLIKGLVESHIASDESGFDDFIAGKGKGLIINLFGPTGVGKTLSAEATSEYVQKPLYVVGVGEISQDLEKKLKQIFDVACTWKAIVLMDEADVFLEQRTVHDLKRNGLVAIFLRQLEYFRGILFLTTNRVKVFDEAFQSRIHISLHYEDLSPSAKRKIWGDFLHKAQVDPLALSQSEWDKLGEANVNGRQIKNAVRSCAGIALSRKEKLCFAHIEEVLTLMKKFESHMSGVREK